MTAEVQNIKQIQTLTDKKEVMQLSGGNVRSKQQNQKGFAMRYKGQLVSK